MIRLYIAAAILAILSGGYWYINNIIEENRDMYATIQVREAQLINNEEAIRIYKKDSEQQLNSVLDEFIKLEEKYSETQQRKRAIIKQIKDSINIAKNSEDIATDINAGTDILFKRTEEITNNYYSTRSIENRNTNKTSTSKANTINTK